MKKPWRNNPPIFQFFKKINKDGPVQPHALELGKCWQWTASLVAKTGYGQFRYTAFGKTEYRAHRCSWVIHFGKIPDGLCVLHKCDNPGCVNPSHLFLGTALDNERDKISKGRKPIGDDHWSRRKPERVPKGVKRKNSKLTNEKVKEIRAMNASGMMHTEIATHFGVTDTLIGMVAHGKIWKHVK